MTTSLNPIAFIRACARPLVTWCLKHGIRSSQVEQIVRELFVHEAQNEIKNAQGEFSVSKVSVMTGLHRTEVARLLSNDYDEKGAHDVLNRIIGLWSTAKRYRNRDGSRKALTHAGLSSEFAELVGRVSKEITHYPVLFELERIGAIEYQGDVVHLVVQEYTPEEDVGYGLELLSVDVGDLASAIEANLCKKHQEPSLHLRTAFDNIDPQNLGEIRRWIVKKGAEFQAVVRDYLAKFDRDIVKPEAECAERARVAVTAFSYAEEIVPSKPIAPKKRGRKKCS